MGLNSGFNRRVVGVARLVGDGRGCADGDYLEQVLLRKARDEEPVAVFVAESAALLDQDPGERGQRAQLAVEGRLAGTDCIDVGLRQALFPVQVQAYADRVVAEHARQFGRDRAVFNPWHYLPVLLRKPGALRNGPPFQDWPSPPALERLRRALGRGDQADRAFVAVLAAVSCEGIEAVTSACAEALASGAASADVVLNMLARSPSHRPWRWPCRRRRTVPATTGCAQRALPLRPKLPTPSSGGLRRPRRELRSDKGTHRQRELSPKGLTREPAIKEQCRRNTKVRRVTHGFQPRTESLPD
jgi:hypothetical protein